MNKDEQEYDRQRAIMEAFQYGRPQPAFALWDALDIQPIPKLLWEAAQHDHVNMLEFLMAKGVNLSSADPMATVLTALTGNFGLTSRAFDE